MILNFRYPLSAIRYPLSAIRYPLSALSLLIVSNSKAFRNPEFSVFIPTFVGTKNMFMGLIPTKSFFDLTNSFIILTKSFLNLMKSFLVPTKSFFILTKSIFIPIHPFFVLTKSFVNPTKIFVDERDSGFDNVINNKS